MIINIYLHTNLNELRFKSIDIIICNLFLYKINAKKI